MTDPLTLPEGSKLLHIGPHKTGSTAIQDAMDQARHELRAQGVFYASENRHEATPARYVTGRLAPGHNPKRAAGRWASITAEMRAEGPERKVFSSEFLSDATEEQVERIIGDIGTENTYVAVTLRPLASILPSQYQQYLQRGSTFGYESWLDSMFNKPPYDHPTPSFWKRHRHDELVQRWGKVVGPENVVVVMVDSRDFTVAPRAFEQLLGLTDGTLADKEVTANRSMTWGEAEVMRQFNRQFKDAKLPPDLHLTLMKSAGAHVKDRVPGPDEAKIVTPAWAVKKANDFGAEMASTIEATGARILGDLSLLSSGQVKDVSTDPPITVAIEIASRFAAGFAIGANQVAEDAAADVEAAHEAARRSVETVRKRAQARADARIAKATPVPPPAPRSLPRRAASRAKRAALRLRRG
ncbi:MAG: hypothetical protein ACXWDI_00925 [Nocardioides sp.]